MVNMVTNIIIKDEIYLILFAVYSQLLDDDIQKIKDINEDSQTLESVFGIHTLKINNNFNMNYKYRETFPIK